ncbi:hypothetical protein NC652_024336 [Populus alba x Populus x berolinensis]|nr:hypothetical protein NC652_024336 [Populus alba x Populus x berolinensis]
MRYEYVLYEGGHRFRKPSLLSDHDIFWGPPITPASISLATSPGDNTVHTVKGTSGDKFGVQGSEQWNVQILFSQFPTQHLRLSRFIFMWGHIPSEHDLCQSMALESVYSRAELMRATRRRCHSLHSWRVTFCCPRASTLPKS